MGFKILKQKRKTTASSVKGEDDVDCVCLLFFVSVGFVHHEFSPPSHNVNKQYYLEVIKRL
jgi:hypothetical protein